MIKKILVPYIDINDESIKNVGIYSLNNKYFYIYLKNNELEVSNNLDLLKNMLNTKYLPFLRKIYNNLDLIEKTYNFFQKNQPSFLTPEELKKIDLKEIIDNNIISSLKVSENIQEQIKQIFQSQKFQYTDLNYKIYEDGENENFKFDEHNEIEKKIAEIFSIGDKIAFLVGTTGIGKTYSLKNFAKKNNLNTYYTAVSHTGDARVSILGQRTLEVENGQQKVSHNPGAGLMAFRDVVENKKNAVLIVDEILRGEASDVTTIFSINKDEKGNKFYQIEGVEYYYIAIIENLKGEKSKVLLSDRNVEVDLERGKILKPASYKLTKEQIIELMRNGNISKVTRDFLNKNNYKIVNVLEKIKEEFYIPVSKLKISFIANVGEDFLMSKIDSATISRSGVIIIDNTKITPENMLKILKKQTKTNNINFRDLTLEEKQIKEEFLIKFFKTIKTGIQIDNIMLPKRAYSMRNLETLYSINKIPENKNILDYLTDNIKDLFILNYVDYEIGKENIEPNTEQYDFILQSLDEIKNLIKTKNNSKKFNLEEEIKNKEKNKQEELININKKRVAL